MDHQEIIEDEERFLTGDIQPLAANQFIHGKMEVMAVFYVHEAPHLDEGKVIRSYRLKVKTNTGQGESSLIIHSETIKKGQ